MNPVNLNHFYTDLPSDWTTYICIGTVILFSASDTYKLFNVFIKKLFEQVYHDLQQMFTMFQINLPYFFNPLRSMDYIIFSSFLFSCSQSYYTSFSPESLTLSLTLLNIMRVCFSLFKTTVVSHICWCNFLRLCSLLFLYHPHQQLLLQMYVLMQEKGPFASLEG